MFPPSSQPPPLPPVVRERMDYGRSERLTLPWKIVLIVACLAICALVVRLIYGYTIVKEIDASKTDISTVQAADKRLGELQNRFRVARTPQQRCQVQYLILDEIKMLPTKLSGYSRATYEKLRAISAPLNDATLAYNKNITAFFGADGSWLSVFAGTPEELSQSHERLQALAEENQNLHALYKERIATLARETHSGRDNSSLTRIYQLAEDKKPAYNLIRDSDAKIYETIGALLQLLISNKGYWRGDRLPFLQWDSKELARQSDDLFEELAILFSQQSDAQLELLGLTWNR